MIRSTRVARFLTAMWAAALLAGCVGAPQPSSTEASASNEPLTPGASATGPAVSASTDATPGATDGPVPEGAIVIVVADELRLRAEPGTGGTVLGSVERGTVVRTTEGPVEIDGFRWYRVVDTTGRDGWAADGDGSDPWLSSIESSGDATALLALTSECDVVGPFNAPSTVVLGDGRVVLRGSDFGAWSVRRLSPAGVAHLQDNVLTSPYLQTSAVYEPIRRADAPEPPGHGACVFTFLLETDSELVRVRSVMWFGEQEETSFYEPAPERKALDEIARNLMAIDSVLDDPSWEASGWLPYIAEDYVLWAGPGVGPAPEGLVAIDPDALPVDIEAFGEAADTGRCGPISREQAFELARVLNQAGADPDVRLDATNFFGFEADGTWANLTLVPRTPQYELSCDEFSF